MEGLHLAICLAQARQRSIQEYLLVKEDKDWRVWRHNRASREEQQCKSMPDMRQQQEVTLHWP